MATRSHSFITGEYYHIYNRGNSKQDIFKSVSDYERFITLLFLANGANAFEMREIDHSDVFLKKRGPRNVYIGCYCLMPNHFHILISPARDTGVGDFMLKLCTAYVMYFNQKYDRSGRLFEGTYKSKYVVDDRYLKYLYAYIHLNPFVLEKNERNKTKKYSSSNLGSYSYSSLPYYLGLKSEFARILDPDFYPKYFSSPKEHEKELYEWIELDT